MPTSGGSYSQLFVGAAVTLDGALQIVLQPELFQGFGYTPQVGDTFDFVIGNGAITLASGLDYMTFVSSAGAGLIGGLSLSAYSSGIASDPDSLFLANETIFNFSLVENGTILRGTLIEPFALTSAVPIPAAVWLFGSGLLGLIGVARKRHRTR